MSKYKQSNISSRDNNNEFTEAQTDANDVTMGQFINKTIQNNTNSKSGYRHRSGNQNTV